MAAGDSTIEPGLGGLLGSVSDAYEQMPMPIERYLLVVLAPATAFFLATVVIVIFVELPALIAVPLPLLGLLGFAAALLYPRLLVEQERQEINKQLHLLITHMTVLSTTNIARMEVFRELAAEEEYGALATEMQRIVELVDVWNQSLDDACRRRAGAVPSRALSDLLDRLAYTLTAGQELSDFLLSEQDVIIQNYATIYEGALDNLEVMKDLYLSMILSMTFGLVFAVILPILTGTNPAVMVAGVLFLFILVQLGFTYIIYQITPFDPVWYRPSGYTPRTEPTLRQSLVIGGVGCALLIGLVAGEMAGAFPVRVVDVLPIDRVPLPIYAVIPLTPLLIPGLVMRQAERAIKGRDDEFPSFIRALGAAEDAKQTTTVDVLTDLRTKDFGPLTTEIQHLYKRLNMRIEPAKAWRYFAADTQSYLIQKFSEMYLIGRQMGGNPKRLGELISQNMNEVLQLREQRDQGTVTLIGLLYGISAAATFAFFMGLEVVQILAGMSLPATTAASFDVNQLLFTGQYDIPLVEFMLILVILANALISSIMVRVVDGGHPANAYLHFVVLSWISAIIAVITRGVVSAFLVI